jgi:hypothetical protein
MCGELRAVARLAAKHCWHQHATALLPLPFLHLQATNTVTQSMPTKTLIPQRKLPWAVALSEQCPTLLSKSVAAHRTASCVPNDTLASPHTTAPSLQRMPQCSVASTCILQASADRRTASCGESFAPAAAASCRCCCGHACSQLAATITQPPCIACASPTSTWHDTLQQ